MTSMMGRDAGRRELGGGGGEMNSARHNSPEVKALVASGLCARHADLEQAKRLADVVAEAASPMVGHVSSVEMCVAFCYLAMHAASQAVIESPPAGAHVNRDYFAGLFRAAAETVDAFGLPKDSIQ